MATCQTINCQEIAAHGYDRQLYCYYHWINGGGFKDVTDISEDHGQYIEEEASDLVRMGPRQDAYGHPKVNFGRLAQMWSAYKGVEFTPADVAIMFILHKAARLAQDPTHRDSRLDLLGYAINLDMVLEDE